MQPDEGPEQTPTLENTSPPGAVTSQLDTIELCAVKNHTSPTFVNHTSVKTSPCSTKSDNAEHRTTTPVDVSTPTDASTPGAVSSGYGSAVSASGGYVSVQTAGSDNLLVDHTVVAVTASDDICVESNVSSMDVISIIDSAVPAVDLDSPLKPTTPYSTDEQTTTTSCVTTTLSDSTVLDVVRPGHECLAFSSPLTETEQCDAAKACGDEVKQSNAVVENEDRQDLNSRVTVDNSTSDSATVPDRYDDSRCSMDVEARHFITSTQKTQKTLSQHHHVRANVCAVPSRDMTIAEDEIVNITTLGTSYS